MNTKKSNNNNNVMKKKIIFRRKTTIALLHRIDETAPCREIDYYDDDHHNAIIVVIIRDRQISIRSPTQQFQNRKCYRIVQPRINVHDVCEWVGTTSSSWSPRTKQRFLPCATSSSIIHLNSERPKTAVPPTTTGTTTSRALPPSVVHTSPRCCVRAEETKRQQRRRR
jgi:hypothetical protein